MDINFQDRIDQYLLHPDTMSEEEKAQFLKEVEEDAEKKRQFELTVNLKAAIKSREEKLQAIRMTQRQHDWESRPAAAGGVCCGDEPDMKPAPAPQAPKASGRGKWVYWLSGVAAVVAIGFFVIRPTLSQSDMPEILRSADDENSVFEGGVHSPSDTLLNDTLSDDTLSSEFIVEP